MRFVVEHLKSILEQILNIDFLDGIISNSTNKEELSKIKLRPVLLKEKLLFQVTKYCGKQVFHENLEKEQLIEAFEEWFFCEGVKLKQAELHTKQEDITVLISKKGKVTLKRKKRVKEEREFRMDLSHNRAKRYILEEGMQVPFLV